MGRDAMKTILTLAGVAFLGLDGALLQGFAAPRRQRVATDAVLVDRSAKPIKDQRNSSCAPDLGYAGCLLEFWPKYDAADWLYDKANDAATWKVLDGAGVHLVRQWGAVMAWQTGRVYAKTSSADARLALRKRRNGDCPDPHKYFSFWKRHGIRALLTLEHYKVYAGEDCAQTANDLATVKRTILDYVKWIRDNGYAETVAGFELGNEAYWGNNPEDYAARWCEILPDLKRMWPEVRIGIPLAEYAANDPDIAAVRARATGLEWVEEKGAFKFNKLNQWSGRFVTAMSNQLHNVSHVIYHFYGANRAYGCGNSGFERYRAFAKVFPEVADKRVWITEWRERSDEDNRCHQTFFSSLWKGHYMLAVLAQPEIDGISLHNLASLSGGINAGGVGSWHTQWNPAGRDYDQIVPTDKVRIEVGPAGPVFRLYCNALLGHPVILDHGHLHVPGKVYQGENSHFWCGTVYYETGCRRMDDIAKGKDAKHLTAIDGNVEWVTALSADGKSLAVLMTNTLQEDAELPVRLKDGVFSGEAVTEWTTIPERHVFNHLVPGEKPLWIDGRRTDKAKGDRFVIRVGKNSVQTVVLPIGAAKGAK